MASLDEVMDMLLESMDKPSEFDTMFDRSCEDCGCTFDISGQQVRPYKTIKNESGFPEEFYRCPDCSKSLATLEGK